MPADHDDASAPFPPVRVVSGGAFELIAQLAAFTSGPARASLESGKTWIRDVRALAGRDLIRRTEAWALPVYGPLAAVALETPEPHDPAQLVERIRAAPPGTMRRLLAGDSPSNRSMVSDGAFERALAGDAAAHAELRRGLGLTPAGRRALDRVLALPEDAVQAEIAAVVEHWAIMVFPAFADSALAAIRRDAAAKQRRLDEGIPARDLVQAALNGVDPGDAWGAGEAFVVPTVALRPFVIPVDIGVTMIYLCSVADEALDDDPAAPPRRLVKVAFAMSDPIRLRILHVLAWDALTASEIADRLGLDRTTLHHHLGILRSASLLSIRDEGAAGWRYARRTDGIADATRSLEAYLSPPGGGR